VYHTSLNGDPIFVADHNGQNPRQIYIEKVGTHNHFPIWSPDGRFIYFVQWVNPNSRDADIWRVSSSGGRAERVTSHHSEVVHPAFLDNHTLIYCAGRPDGSGMGLWGLDLERKVPHLLTSGVEEYISVSASSDGRRVVATVANPIHSLWNIPISDRLVDQSGVTRMKLPSVRAASPRYGRDYILYLSSKGGADGLWRWKDGSETELWKGSDGRVPFAPSISLDGAQIAFVVEGEHQAFLYVMATDGTGAHRLAEQLDVVDSPSWSPDGKWIAVVATEGKTHPVFLVPAGGGAPVRLVEGINSNPVWSPDGRVILYSEYERAASNRLRGVTVDKKPIALPEIRVRYQGNRYRFLPDGKSAVVMQGETWRPDFWLLNLETGRFRQLTDLGKGGIQVANFDVSPDGQKILFDGLRENSDLVLIDLPPR
jgi:Tol biopolymer transport system component